MSRAPLNPTITASRARQRLEEGFYPDGKNSVVLRKRGVGGDTHKLIAHKVSAAEAKRVAGRAAKDGTPIIAHSDLVRRQFSLREAEAKPATVRTSTIFDDKDPATSYPTGTEINFGETAPVDMAGIPDLFDPAAVTGDGI